MSKVAKTTIGLMIVTMLSKVLGFGREVVLSYVYGATAQADAYITAMSIPTVMFSSVGTALATTFIPLYYEVNNIEGEEKSLKFANNIFNIVIMISVFIAIIGFIFATPLVKIFAIDFNGEKLRLAVILTKIMILGIVFIGLSNIMTSWLQINGNFIIPGMIGIPFNILIIASIFISRDRNILILGIGTLLAIASQFLFQLPFSYKQGYRYKLFIDLSDKYLKRMIWLILPVFIGVGVNQINTIIDRSLASTLGDGVILVLNNANRLNGFVVGLFIATLGAVIYPILSKLSSEGDKEQFVKSVSMSVNSVILLVIPISVGAIVLAEPVVRLVFERGKFDANATSMTAIALAFYSIGMVSFGLRDILGKVFYSLKDTKTPMINGAITMGLNIILNIILVKVMGYSGLAFATSISAIICIFLLFKSLKNKIGYFGQDKIAKTTIKSLLASIIMGVVTKIAYSNLNILLGSGFIKEAVSLLVSIGTGVIVYVIVVIVLQVDEISLMMNIIKTKVKSHGVN